MTLEQDFQLDPEKHIFTPRPDIKPIFGCQEHIDLLRPFSKCVRTESNVRVLLEEDGLCLYKASVRELCEELGLRNLELEVIFLASLNPGSGWLTRPKPGSRDGITKHEVVLSFGASDKLASELEIEETLWEEMKEEKGKDEFSDAEFLTINNVFFHEFRHIKDFDSCSESVAKDFDLGRTRRMLNGELRLAAIWSLSPAQLLS